MFGTTAEMEATFTIDLSDRPVQAGESAVERFAYVLILGITWGTEWSRWIQTGQMFLVHFFVSRHFFGSSVFRCSRASADWRPMSTYRGWASYTHELVALPWILGVGFGCINCKDTLRDAAYVVYLVSVWS